MSGYVDLLLPCVPEHQAFAKQPSGLIVPQRFAQRRVVGIDLFAGCGGFSLGFVQAGFEVAAALDHDPIAAMTYMHNLGQYPCKFHFVEKSDEDRMEKCLQRHLKGKGIKEFPTVGSGWIASERRRLMAPDSEGRWSAAPRGVGHFFLGDARKVKGQDFLTAIGMAAGEVDCVFGGPPCQGFSTSGKRDIMDPRNSLIFEFARLVCEIQPKTMVMENVPAIASMVTPEGMPVLDAFTLILEEGGFGLADAIKASLLGEKGRGAVRRKTLSRTGGKVSEEENDALPEPTLFETK